MIAFEEWNYGGVQRGILPNIKKGIISYEKAACSSSDYSFARHAQARLLCKNMLTNTIDFFQELVRVVEYLYHHICLKCFDSRSPQKEARAT